MSSEPVGYDDTMTEGAGRAALAGVAEGAPRPGDEVGRYKIERLLGAGGMGLVFAAHDPDLDRRVALKLLRRDKAGADSSARVRLLREARAMARLSHPNVITVFEVGTAGERDFVAMELIEGSNVAEWLAATRRTVHEVVRVFHAAGRGLAAAHAGGLVHRDFKPHNVLIGRDGRVVVTDFGLARATEVEAAEAAAEAAAKARALAEAEAAAKAAEQELLSPRAPHVMTVDSGHVPTPPAPTGRHLVPELPPARRRALRDSATLSATLTRSGAMLGTPAYMAPEQFGSTDADPRSDQFSFCVALWEGLTGKRPFQGGSIDELRRDVACGIGEEDGPELPRRLRALLLRGMAPDPVQRWPSMDALLDTLVPAPPRHWPRWIAAAALAVGLLAAVGVWLAAPKRGAVVASVAPACGSADEAFAVAWSEERRALLDAKFQAYPAVWQRVSGQLDAYRGAWSELWDRTCAAPEDPTYHARLTCLEGVRDEVASLARSGETIPAEVIERVPDLAEILPRLDGCAAPVPANPPPQPPASDPALRDAVATLRAKMIAARIGIGAGPDEPVGARSAAVADEARTLGWAPLVAEALEAHASALVCCGDPAAAEAIFEEAALIAESTGHDQARAQALAGLLEVVAGRSSDGPHIRELAKRATAAVTRAGGDRLLQAAIDLELAKVSGRERAWDDAIAGAERARAGYLAIHDVRRAGLAAWEEAMALVGRGAAGDRAQALALMREAAAAAEAAYGDTDERTIELLDTLGTMHWMAGELDEAHALFDRVAAFRDSEAGRASAARKRPGLAAALLHDLGEPRTLRGRVLDAAGAPVAGATVHAGSFLSGDGRRFVMRAGKFHATGAAARATTDADGVFVLEGVPGETMLVAEHGALRSFPMHAGPRVVEAVLRVVAPARVEGVLEGADPAHAIALLAASAEHSESTYAFVAAIGDDGRFALDGVPPGHWEASVVIDGAAGDYHAESHLVTVRPGGASLRFEVARGEHSVDVLVRSTRSGAIVSAQVFLARSRFGARNAAELSDALMARRSHDLAIAAPLGAGPASAQARELHAAGDAHARFTGVAAGEHTVCIVPLGGDYADTAFLRSLQPHRRDLDVVCRPLTVAEAPAEQLVVIEVAPMKRLP